MHISKDILYVLNLHGKQDSIIWLNEKIEKLSVTKSAKDLFMIYSLLAAKFDGNTAIKFNQKDVGRIDSFVSNKASLLEISRIYLLTKVLEIDADYYAPKVANIIQVGDTNELKTFLKYLILLPKAEFFKNTAVEALRTNIAIIFDAITLNNPYPAKYFNDQQWNQMYLKAAFMERDLSMIQSVDERANQDLTRIISDYAHERWAASRKIDPMFWRPVSKFMNEVLLSDMKRLLSSKDINENRAGALCCFYSGNKKAMTLLDGYSELKNKIASKEINWNTLKK